MRVHAIMHAKVEGPGRVAEWAAARGHELTSSFGFTEEFPDAAELGLLVVLGGPMDADDHIRSPWLIAEKAWIRDVVDAGVPVLGICLGSQILAEVLGGRVARNPVREIGWWPVELTDEGRTSRMFAEWPARPIVGQWHGDTFELPVGIAAAATSPAAANQAFDFEGRVVGVQFHLEWDESVIADLLGEFSAEVAEGGPWVQSPAEIAEGARANAEACATMLWQLLDALAES